MIQLNTMTFNSIVYSLGRITMVSIEFDYLIKRLWASATLDPNYTKLPQGAKKTDKQIETEARASNFSSSSIE